jgi:hypothetical protein
MPVPAYVSKLETILKIGDITERREALAEYARSLGIKVEKARKLHGEVDEDQLTVLIFNAERNRAFFRSRRFGLIFGTLFVFTALMAGLFLLTQLMEP